MTTTQDRIVGALTEEWRLLRALVDDLTSDQWATPTCLPGWDVRDQIAHVIGDDPGIVLVQVDALGLKPLQAGDQSVAILIRRWSGVGQFDTRTVHRGRATASAPLIEKDHVLVRRQHARNLLLGPQEERQIGGLVPARPAVEIHQRRQQVTLRVAIGGRGLENDHGDVDAPVARSVARLIHRQGAASQLAHARGPVGRAGRVGEYGVGRDRRQGREPDYAKH
jgi:uncharacterized protein (TIGR03083 family)